MFKEALKRGDDVQAGSWETFSRLCVFGAYWRNTWSIFLLQQLCQKKFQLTSLEEQFLSFLVSQDIFRFGHRWKNVVWHVLVKNDSRTSPGSHDDAIHWRTWLDAMFLRVLASDPRTSDIYGF